MSTSSTNMHNFNRLINCVTSRALEAQSLQMFAFIYHMGNVIWDDICKYILLVSHSAQHQGFSIYFFSCEISDMECAA